MRTADREDLIRMTCKAKGSVAVRTLKISWTCMHSVQIFTLVSCQANTISEILWQGRCFQLSYVVDLCSSCILYISKLVLDYSHLLRQFTLLIFDSGGLASDSPRILFSSIYESVNNYRKLHIKIVLILQSEVLGL